MKILIATDIEGIANVWRPEQTVPGSPDYERARRWMTAEASAAVRGACAAGATEVWVNDSHGHYANILADELDPRARLIQGKPRQLGMLAGIEQGIDGVLLIGWHTRSKSAGALAHSINSFAFSRLWLNDLEIGEIGLYGALAAERGVPLLMMSGCERAAEEATNLFPDIACAIVKWSQGARAGASLSNVVAQELIEKTAESACRAWQMINERSPVPEPLLARPVRVRLQCQTPALADLFSLWPSVRRAQASGTGGQESAVAAAADTVAFDCASVHEAVRSLNALSAMSTALR